MIKVRTVRLVKTPSDLTSIRNVTEGKIYNVFSQGMSEYKKPAQMTYRINDNNGAAIVLYENEVQVIN